MTNIVCVQQANSAFCPRIPLGKKRPKKMAP